MYSLVICISCQASLCKSMLVLKLYFNLRVVELVVFFIFHFHFRWFQSNRLGNDSQTDELQKRMLKGELAWLSTYFVDSLTCTKSKVSIMYSFVIYNSCQGSLCKSMLVLKLYFYLRVVELVVFITFHLHF